MNALRNSLLFVTAAVVRMSAQKRLLAVTAGMAMWAALQCGTVSAQTGGVGGDGYTRMMWRGTDGSISLWKLDSALISTGAHNYGPYSGWLPIAMTTTGSNLSYVLWNYTNGTATIWEVDANLNYVSSPYFGPVAGWTAEALGVDSSGNIRLLWKSTEGQLSVWTLNPTSLNVIAQTVFGPYFGWNPP